MTVVSMESHVVRHPDLVFAHMGEEVVMMSQDQGDYLGLNAVASAIWEMTESPQRVADICTQLQERYEVTPEQCQRDVLIFMQQMLDKELIQLASA